MESPDKLRKVAGQLRKVAEQLMEKTAQQGRKLNPYQVRAFLRFFGRG